MLAIAAVYRRATSYVLRCCQQRQVAPVRPLSAPAERAILNAPPRFAAPAHVQSKSLGPRKFLRRRTRRCLRYLPASSEHLDS